MNSSLRFACTQTCLLALFLLAGCRRTVYAPGFNQQKFWEVKIDAPTDAVLASTGIPIRAWQYYTDPDPKHTARAIDLDAESIVKASKISDSYVVCDYSTEGNFAMEYVSYKLYLRNGEVVKKEEYVMDH